MPSPGPKKKRRPLWSVAGLSQATAFLGFVSTGLGLCGRAHWFAELFTHFQLQLAIGFLALAGVLFVRRDYRWAWPCALAGLSHTFVISPFIQFFNSDTPSNAPAFRVLAANVHTGNSQYDRLLTALRAERTDVILLMEVNDAWIRGLAPLLRSHPYTVLEPRADNFGIAIYSRLPLTATNVVFLGSAEVPSIELRVMTGGRILSLLLTHPVPPVGRENAADRDDQLQAIAEWSRRQEYPAAVIGDLNCTPWSPRFRDLLRDGGLRDAGRDLGAIWSWPVQPGLLRIPIDHCLTRGEVHVRRRHRLPDIGSDHFPIRIELGW